MIQQTQLTKYLFKYFQRRIRGSWMGHDDRSLTAGDSYCQPMPTSVGLPVFTSNKHILPVGLLSPWSHSLQVAMKDVWFVVTT